MAIPKTTSDVKVTIFAQLPIEIMRDVFELAAWTSTPAALRLSLVSTWVKRWAAPSLYHTVILRTSHALDSFLLALQHTDNPSQLVRYIGIFALGPLRSIDRVLAACSGVESVACGFTMSRMHPIFSLRTVLRSQEQHFLGLSCRDGLDLRIVDPSVRRLRVCVADALDYSSILAALPELTHFAVWCRRKLLFYILETLQAMLKSHDLSHLQVLVVQVCGASKIVESEDWSPIPSDPRLVVESAPSSATVEWENAAKRGETVWDAAERVVAKRLSQGRGRSVVL
ncbi:hypothetical protein PLICRDRAFT_477841 [Plicaturopsis crispa FD-325 SS-3]|nr:hypothetical protein PLICRDRAFT_477841 [Plicaturopsis crispa FD-325 SS-3]